MPIVTETTPFATFVHFLPLGLAFTVPAAGTVAATAKPDVADPVWEAGNLGDLEEFTFTPEVETAEKVGWRAGGMVRVDEYELSRKQTLKWKTTDLTPLVHRLLFGTEALTGASNQANPLEGPLLVKGWLKIQAYSLANRRVTGDFWASLKITNADPWSGKNIVQAEFEAHVLHSTLNTLKFE